MSNLMKMITDGLWSCESNTDPLENKVPQTTESVASEEKVNSGFRAATPAYAKNVIMMKDSHTKKIIFSSKSVAKKSPNEHGNL